MTTTATNTSATSERNEHSERNLSVHLSELADEASTLFRKEIELARLEVKAGVDDMKRGATWIGSSGAVLYAGALFVLGAVTVFIARFLPLDAAALIVGLATLAAGYAMYARGKKDIHPEALVPRRTLRSVKETPSSLSLTERTA
jgi:hypothetical protein